MMNDHLMTKAEPRPPHCVSLPVHMTTPQEPFVSLLGIIWLGQSIFNSTTVLLFSNFQSTSFLRLSATSESFLLFFFNHNDHHLGHQVHVSLIITFTVPYYFSLYHWFYVFFIHTRPSSPQSPFGSPHSIFSLSHSFAFHCHWYEVTLST